MSRINAIADAWIYELNAHEFGHSLGTRRVKTLTEPLAKTVTMATFVMPRSDRAMPLTRESYDQEIEIATCLRVRATADLDTDTLDALAERISDFAKVVTPLTHVDGFPVSLVRIQRTLWVPKELEEAGVYASLMVHTWRVETES